MKYSVFVFMFAFVTLLTTMVKRKSAKRVLDRLIDQEHSRAIRKVKKDNQKTKESRKRKAVNEMERLERQRQRKARSRRSQQIKYQDSISTM